MGSLCARQNATQEKEGGQLPFSGFCVMGTLEPGDREKGRGMKETGPDVSLALLPTPSANGLNPGETGKIWWCVFLFS